MPNLEIPSNNNEIIINNPFININDLSVCNNKYIINKQIDKAITLAKYFADINNKKRNSSSQAIERIVAHAIENFNNKNGPPASIERPIINFNDTNTVSNRIYDIEQYFF